MYRVIHKDNFDDLDEVMCMSNLRGNKIKVPHKMPFSFYFSQKRASHSIRVKPMFNPNELDEDLLGNLELHGDWKYTPGKNDKHVKSRLKNEMIDFFKTYKVLFAAVWEKQIEEDSVQDYFRGIISFRELIKEFKFYRKYEVQMDDIRSVQELESFVRKNSIFNMND